MFDSFQKSLLPGQVNENMTVKVVFQHQFQNHLKHVSFIISTQVVYTRTGQLLPCYYVYLSDLSSLQSPFSERKKSLSLCERVCAEALLKTRANAFSNHVAGLLIASHNSAAIADFYFFTPNHGATVANHATAASFAFVSFLFVFLSFNKKNKKKNSCRLSLQCPMSCSLCPCC